MTGGSLTTTVVAVCACLLAQALVGCAADPAPKPRAGAAAVVLEVVAAPKKGAKANRFTRVPVYDAAPQPAAPSGQFELVSQQRRDALSSTDPETKAPYPTVVSDSAYSSARAADFGSILSSSSAKCQVLRLRRSSRPETTSGQRHQPGTGAHCEP